MFGKKQVEAPNRSEINLKFSQSLRQLKRSIDVFDQKIEAEVANAIAYKKAGNIDEEHRSLKKIERYLAAKIQKERFYDNVELVKERIDDILDKVEVSRNLSDTFGTIGNLVDSKELKSIMGEFDAFNKNFAKTNNMMDAFMGQMDESVNNMNLDPSYASSVQNLVNDRMKGYETRIEEQAAAELDESSFNFQ
ncbi:MAG: Snf7 family protein [Bacilli bacterium]|nr:Snf7 family protein [Bacilli bacterium]